MMKKQKGVYRLHPEPAVTPLLLSIRKLIAGGFYLGVGMVPAHAELPVPSVPAVLSSTPVDIASQGQASASVSGNTMTITQGTDKARIDWQRFNIGQENAVNFNQPSSTSVALNQIHQNDPSRIMGSLTANGQVYLVNQNGFVFGPQAQINVNSLVATTLGISESVFQNGLTKAFDNKGSAALEGGGEVYLKDEQGRPLLDQQGQKIKIQILIEHGAQIKTNSTGGRVIIAAPVVNNAGSIEAPDGQVILAAAKDKVYLQEADNDSDIRGLLVEVGTGGEVNNIGKVLAERGNASLIGFAVNQQGLASATTSVNLNGTVRLLAREGIQDKSGTSGKLLAKSTVRNVDLDDGLGTASAVNLESGSVTSVGLDSDKSSTAIDAQVQNRSKIEISGHDITLKSQARVSAKSGEIALNAVDNLGNPEEKGNARIELAAGSTIDASGVRDVALPMSRNTVQVELRKNELRDAPLQRNGVLYGQTVSVDIREADLSYDADGRLTAASIPIADIKGAVDRIARNIDERSTAGGNVTLKSSGDIITHSGSVIDFSGGSVNYQDGLIDSSTLLSGGQMVDIAHADPNQHYDSILGLVIVNHPKWGVTERWSVPGLTTSHFESGYSEGKAGGNLALSAYRSELNGTLIGATIAGTRQRTSSQRAQGSSLSIDLNNNNLLGYQDILFVSSDQSAGSETRKSLVKAVSQSDQTPPLVIDTALFERSGIEQVSIKTNGTIRLEKDSQLNLPVDGELSLAASGFELAGAINVPAGKVSLKPVSVGDTLLPSAIHLTGTASIDVSGTWVNDPLDIHQHRSFSPIANNGGVIGLLTEQGDLQLDTGSVLHADAGAWLNNQYHLLPGTGGTIDLRASTNTSGAALSSLRLQGALTAWSMVQGGHLALSSNEVILGNASNVTANSQSSVSPLILDTDFFRQGGFSDFHIVSTAYGLTVADNSRLSLKQTNLQPDNSFSAQRSGSSLATFSQKVMLPDSMRNPVNLHLSSSEPLGQDQQQMLAIGSGVNIETDIGGSVSLEADTSIQINGTIRAPGGQITAAINTPVAGDKGYYDSQGIWLGAESQLLAPGGLKPELNYLGLRAGQVLPGGTISLTAKRGYIVSNPGSLIDVSGSSSILDFQQSGRVISERVASAGGSILLTAGEGMVLNSQLNAQSGAEHSLGGTLSVELNRGLRNKPLIPGNSALFPDDINPSLPRTIVIGNDNTAINPGRINSGEARLNIDQINNGGLGSLLLKTDVLGADGQYAGGIEFKNDLELNVTRQVILDTPSLRTDHHRININTAYARLGSTQSRIDIDQGNGEFQTTLAPDATGGDGQLVVNTQGLDLVGGLSFSGFGNVMLNSQTDSRVMGIRGRSDSKDFLGELKLVGDLRINTSQLYPVTLTHYQIALDGNGQQSFTLQENGMDDAPVYSAAGQLVINSANIVQSGRLKAPLGQLELNAGKQLTLTPGSLTSISGDQLTVPFGQGSAGSNWLYPMDSTGNTNLVINEPPAKHLTLTGKSIALNEGAVINLSGGGDLYAYEFISGPGGSNDILDPNTPGFQQKFAVIPTLGSGLAPYDPQWSTSSGIDVGDSLYLSSGSSLAEGWYTLLPAHYALLPGAYLVTPKPGFNQAEPSQTIVDVNGSTIVAGRYGVFSTGTVESLWQNFAVEPGSVARMYSQFNDYSANTFFSGVGSNTRLTTIPNDAGSVAINAQAALSLGAQVMAMPKADGNGGQVDISADHLAIVNGDELGASGNNAVTILADDLTQLNAPSILLGGVRQKTASGQQIMVSAKDLTIGSGVKLQGEEIILAAKNELQIKSGAYVASTGLARDKAVDLAIENVSKNTSDAAVVWLSNANQINLTRDKPVTGKSGTLTVESGAQLQSDHSMRIDATKDTRFAGSVNMEGGALTLKASKISLGDAPSSTPGLVLASTPFNLDRLQLISASGVDLYGSIAVTAGMVTIDSAQLSGFDNAGAVASIHADTLELRNSNSLSTTAGNNNATGTGTLSLNADQIRLGAGNYRIDGFDQIQLHAETAINGSGLTIDPNTVQSDTTTPANLTVAGNLLIQAGRVGGDPGSTVSINAAGHSVNLEAIGDAGGLSENHLGSHWSITGNTISTNAYFDLPSGNLSLSAVNGDIALNRQTRIDVSGRLIDFPGMALYSPAGQVSLSATGNILLAEDSYIDLSGATRLSQQASHAGILNITAPNGQFSWLGRIIAHDGVTADGQYQQGQFLLDVGQLPGGFSVLNTQLANAGFNERIGIRQRTGDLSVAATDMVYAKHVELGVDQGKVNVAGHIVAESDSTDATVSSISLYGRNGIALASTAKLVATAKNTDGNGGDIFLDTVHQDDNGSGLLDLSDTGAVIDVSAGAEAKPGSVHLRTGRDELLHTVAITDINTQFLGTTPGHTFLEATRIYDGLSTIKDRQISAWKDDTRQFMAKPPVLNNSSGSEITVVPGIEIRGDSQLTLADRWDLLGWRYADAQHQATLPGYLTLRAKTDLNINATLTDGFATGFIPGQSSIQLQDMLQPGTSWSYQLVAGNHINLANHYMAADPYGGSQRVSSQVMVRTGTGNIGLNAGGDIHFVTDPVDTSASASIYTMGRPAEYTRSQILSGTIPAVPVRMTGESDTDYLNRLDPVQMNKLLRYGYFNESLLGLAFPVGEYPVEGGDIHLHAGANIDGIATGQSLGDWLVRSGVIDENHRPTAWGINISGDRNNAINGISAKGKHYFNQNVGALGGGNVTVESGGDIHDLSVMLPTTGKPFGQLSAANNQWIATGSQINGGGNLLLTSDGNIIGGEYFVGRGQGYLNAGGSISAGANGLGILLELADGHYTVQSRQEATIASVFNPTTLKQTGVLPVAAGSDSRFFSYGEHSGLQLTAIAGNIQLQNDVDVIRTAKQIDPSLSSGFEYAVYPSTVKVSALSGDILLAHSMTLFPSADGTLSLLANRNVSTDNNAAQLINISESDTDPLWLPGIVNPVTQMEGSLSDGLIRARERLDPTTADVSLVHAMEPLHAQHQVRPAIIARLGDIRFSSNSALTFFLSQPPEFYAGRDIINLSVSAQNLSSTDITRIAAGRDLVFDALIDEDGIIQANDRQIELGGPGQLQIQAGRNISLGGSAGINTIGKTKNSGLAATEGASIQVLAGVLDEHTDKPGFINRYFSSDSGYLDQLLSLTESQRWFPVLTTLFREIKQSAFNAAKASDAQRAHWYQQGYDAIASVFPRISGSAGNLSLVFSQIKTLSGGDIRLVVPNGNVNVGLAGKVGGIQKSADQLGIVAQQTGDIDAFSQGDFNVNQSRVFTMGGGDIVIWSSGGNIDAGKGAKSAISAPAPITSVDSKGNIVTVFPPIVSGSGIQTINPQDKSKKQGNVYLAAPIGVVDAGEAGISGGQIVIAATAVVGASNISASGTSIGVPTAVAVPTIPTGAANAAANAAKSANSNDSNNDSDSQSVSGEKNSATIISTDVIGYGDCSVADVREGKSGCGS